MAIGEGEIVIKEKYGSSYQRFYVKPLDQSTIVSVDQKKSDTLTSIITKIFLPHGYPDSVSKDYINYQIWDTAQAFCSTITGTLATQEVFRGVGVGDTAATPLAATVTWVIKDGCGHLGRILFAYSHGTFLDAYSKKWRLYADTLNDAAMCMEIALPVFKNYTTFVLCISTTMKAIVGVAGGATRMAMTQHHSLRGNMADVSAKDSAQETAVNLIASLTALLILTVFGNSLITFTIMIILHIIFNYFAVRAVCLKTLNEPRFLQVIDTYLNHEVIASPCETNMNEPILFYQLGSNILDLKLCGFKILLGKSIKTVVQVNPRAKYLKNIQDVYKNHNYIVIPYIQRKVMYVVLRDTATTDDILCAYFHAVLLSMVICCLNDYPLSLYTNTKSMQRPFVQVCRSLQEAEWTRDIIDGSGNGFVYEPSIELMKFLLTTAQKEWQLIRMGLQQIGWDMKNHLLVVDEWRISTPKIKKDSATPDPQIESFQNLNLQPTDVDRVTCIIEPDSTSNNSLNKDDDANILKLDDGAKSEVKLAGKLSTSKASQSPTVGIDPDVCQCIHDKKNVTYILRK